ncbi:glycosyltransferase [Butyrivibrio proteoclasticus]|uniref:glycosyltransferase n=1 Tax=Butyrivibrio proteoclasticus TaxID=43305 RepID=UPI000A636F0A|nr:glycosyltransferase [Butyrivibrio proteoclasticus]
MGNVFVVGIVSIYNPIPEYKKNIVKLANMVDLLIIMDDSDVSTISIWDSIISDHIRYIWNSGNLGLCKSVNIGIEHAIKENADWIVFMDQDSEPQNNIISIYKSYIENNNTSEVAMLTPQYNYDRHPRTAKSGYREVTLTNLSGSMVSVDVLRIVGKFDEKFLIDGLDHEWCLRAKKKGYKIFECSQAVLNHNPARTKYISFLGKNIIGFGVSTEERHYYQIKSCLQIISKYKDALSFKILIVKIIKSIFLYGNTNKYLMATRKAFHDYRRGYYGKYNTRLI